MVTTQPQTSMSSGAEKSPLPFNLDRVETLRALQRYTEYLLTNDVIDEAYELLRGLEKVSAKSPEFLEQPSELSRGYQGILNTARAICLPILTEEEVKMYFRSGIVAALRNTDIDLIEKVTANVMKSMYLEERTEFKKKLQFELRQNFERLTLQSVRTKSGVLAPSVKTWIAQAEESALRDEALVAAITRDEQYQKLSPGEQEIVQRLLVLDDFLSIPSDTPEGFEHSITVVDEHGQRFVVEGGEVRPAVDVETKRAFERLGFFAKEKSLPELPSKTQMRQYLGEVQKINQLHSDDDDSRYEAQEVLLKKIGTDTNALVKNLADGLLVNDRRAVLASLGVLSRFGSLDAALQSASIRDAFAEEFLKPLAASAKISLDVVKAMLNRSMKQPQFVAGFLQWALDRALLKNATESARIGNQFGNTLAALGDPSYVAMTYFDVKSGSFKWTPLKMKADGGLEWVG